MTRCETMEMFINDNPDVAMKFMIWEDKILNNQNNNDDDYRDIPDTDFDILN